MACENGSISTTARSVSTQIFLHNPRVILVLPNTLPGKHVGSQQVLSLLKQLCLGRSCFSVIRTFSGLKSKTFSLTYEGKIAQQICLQC